jgi:hypothetical protein
LNSRFRRTPEALEFQPSLGYSLIRNYLDLGQKERLLPILHDKVIPYFQQSRELRVYVFLDPQFSKPTSLKLEILGKIWDFLRSILHQSFAKCIFT